MYLQKTKNAKTKAAKRRQHYSQQKQKSERECDRASLAFLHKVGRPYTYPRGEVRLCRVDVPITNRTLREVIYEVFTLKEQFVVLHEVVENRTESGY